jgi:hypothetical protein
MPDYNLTIFGSLQKHNCSSIFMYSSDTITADYFRAKPLNIRGVAAKGAKEAQGDGSLVLC